MIDVIGRVTFFELLHRFDCELAERTRTAGCPSCGGPLHRAGYDRKPRGGPPVPDELCRRLSLCCGQEGCRRRTLPPSCLFFGRRVYWGCVVLVVVALRQGQPESYSANKLRRLLGVTRQTLVRWMAYFRDVFPSSPCWQRVRGLVEPDIRNTELPASLLERLSDACGGAEEGVAATLRLLASGLAP